MAILEDLGLEVRIVVNDSPLQEYEDKKGGPTDDGFGDEIRKCRRYVEVNGDDEFGVQFRVTNKYIDGKKKGLKFDIDLDGQESLVRSSTITKDSQFLVQGRKEQNGQTSTLRKFRFTTVSTVDDDDTERVKKDKRTADLLGLIRVRVWRVEVRDMGVSRALSQTTSLDVLEEGLAEKAMKGKSLSHRAAFSDAVPTDVFHRCRFKFVDPFAVPLAIFYFKYRSKAILKEELVIPRSREPSPVDDDVDVDVVFDVDGLPLGEIQRLARESLDSLPLREIRRLAQLRLQSAKEESNVSSKGDIKREPAEDQVSQPPRKFVKILDGRTAVDLTGDD